MNSLEELLNKLIQKWFNKIFDLYGVEKISVQHYRDVDDNPLVKVTIETSADYYEYSLRDLVSIESGFRQFVCENDLYDEDKNCIWLSYDGWIWEQDYRYWLMISSVEESLEKFILDNVRVNE